MQVVSPPVSWLETILLLGRLSKKLQRRVLPPFCDELAHDREELTRQLVGREQLGRKKLDGLLPGIIKSGRIPTGLSSEETLFLRLRMVCAGELLDMMFPNKFQLSPVGELPKDWPPQRTLEWLLIDLWKHRCAERLKIDALMLSEPIAADEANPAKTDVRPAEIQA